MSKRKVFDSTRASSGIKEFIPKMHIILKRNRLNFQIFELRIH